MNAVVPISTGNVEAYRASTDAASLCKEIVVATASDIQGRKFVSVEGWQAIAIAHGCTAGARDVERVVGGVRAIGEIRRMSDGAILSTAEGFVGEDEPVWFGGKMRKWKWGKERGQKVWYEEDMPKRADYAIRAMAQTRAISRACRSAFAHVVVMMNAGLSTTPAEEVPDGGFDQEVPRQTVENARPAEVLISDDDRRELMQLATAKNIDAQTLCEAGGYRSVREIPTSQVKRARAWIAKQPKRELGTAKPSAQQTSAGEFDELDGDEIPY